MTGITLIAKAQATEGFEFVYQGGAPICRTCPYRNACLTLDPGRRYRILRVRPIEHPCALQESSAHVVEVESVARPLLVESRSAIVGSSVDVGRYACTRLDCPNWADCAGPTLAPKQRYRIERVPPEAAECRIGRTLKRVDAV